ELGHADVEDNEIGLVGGEAGERLLAVARLGHRHLGLAKRDADDFAYVEIVIDGEDAVGHESLRSAGGRRLINRVIVEPALQSPAPETPASPGSHIRLLHLYKRVTAGNK